MRFDNPDDLRADFPRFTPEALEANFALVDFLKRFGAEKDASTAQIALAWLLAQKPWVVPIPGGTRIAHLEDNLPAADLELTAHDLRRIDEALAALDLVGRTATRPASTPRSTATNKPSAPSKASLCQGGSAPRRACPLGAEP